MAGNNIRKAARPSRVGIAIGAYYSPAEREQWHRMLVGLFVEQKRPDPHKTASGFYKGKFGAWPAYGHRPPPVPPTPEVRSWVRSRQIAYAKAKQKADAAA
jgi:hypothetical protein